MPAISLRQVGKTYLGSRSDAVRQLDLEIADGEFMCLLGPSGCGKTTTLRMIAGLENLSEGKLSIGSRIVDSMADAVFVPPEQRRVGLVFQSYALWPHLTIERNVDFGLRLRKIAREVREERVTEVMRVLGIEQYRSRYPSQLSGGQQQRVALARMLAVNPDVLLLDEPLSNLDARLRLEMRSELKRIHSEYGTTIVFVTHDQWEAMTLATQIAVMNNGTLQQVGTPDDIYARPANRFVAEFVGSPPINIVDLNGSSTGIAHRLRDFLASRLSAGDAELVASVGIRPEALKSADEVPSSVQEELVIDSHVDAVLPTGGSWIVEVTAEGQTVFLTTSTQPKYAAGANLRLTVPSSSLHVFDANERRMHELDRDLGSEAA